MRKRTKNKTTGEKILRQASVVLFLFGFFLFIGSAQAPAAQIDPCDYRYRFPTSRTSTQMVNTQTNTSMGAALFDVRRTGTTTLQVYVAIDLLDTTVLKVYLNGALLGTMEPADINGQEYWNLYLFGPETPLVRVGDEIIITKDVEPLFRGKFIRQSYDWGYVGGFVRPNSSYLYACSTARGYIYLPNSIYRRYLLISPSVLTTSPVTRITVNGPSFYPGGIGDEIASVPIISSAPSTELPYGWIRTHANNDSIGLSVEQYQQLRQGLLTVNVFTELHPNGFAQIPIEIFLLNSSGDFEGDGQADFAVFRPSDQNWYLLYSSNSEFRAVPFGLPNDKLVIGDYDSDGKTDIGAFQIDHPDYPGLGVWQILKSSSGNMSTMQWGLPTDIPLAMHIDKNNTSDLAVFRPSNGTWYIYRMGDIIKPRTTAAPVEGVHYRIIQWGAAGDKPLAGDFDGDGIDELVAFRPASGDWYIYNSVTRTYQILHWGMNGDIPIAKDFDGDARADLAVYRPSDGTWYIQRSLDNSVFALQFGVNNDIPVPADFDKDGVTDIAVFRPSGGDWYVTRSSNNTFLSEHFGTNGDVPAMGQR